MKRFTIISITLCLLAGNNLLAIQANTEQVLTISNMNYNVEDTVSTVSFDNKEVLSIAMKFFNTKKWDKASYAFHKYLLESTTSKERDIQVLYLLAKSKFNMGDYPRAADAYNKYMFLISQVTDQVESAEWDRALCYLNFDNSKAIKCFTQIANNKSHSNQTDAASMLKLL